MDRPSRKAQSREPKRVVGYKLPESVIRAIANEALDKQCWPAHVVEEMARARYGLKLHTRAAQPA